MRGVDLGLELAEHHALALELAVDRHADAPEARDGLLDVAQLLVLLPVVVVLRACVRVRVCACVRVSACVRAAV